MRRLVVSPETADPAALAEAAAWLKGGGLVVYPTDTLYAVAANPESAEAIAALFQWKQRGAGLALPFIAASIAQVVAWAGGLDARSARLGSQCWPGPLSLIVTAPTGLAQAAHAGLGTVAVRVPASAIARALATAWGAPIPATSANVSGTPAVSSLEALGAWLDDPRVFAIDGGPAPGGSPSTIVDARVMPPLCVRAGATPWDRVLKLLEA